MSIHFYRRKANEKIDIMETWWFFLGVVAGVFWMDGKAIYEIQDLGGEMIGIQSDTTIRLIGVSILLALDGLPILLGQFITASKKVMKTVCVVALTLAFLMGVGCYMVQKFTYSDIHAKTMEDGTSYSSGIVDQSYDDYGDYDDYDTPAEIEEEPQEKTPVEKERDLFGLFTNILMTMMPILTSVISFSVSVMRSHGAMYEKMSAIEAEISERRNELLAIDNYLQKNFQEELEQDYQSVILQINSINHTMKSDFRTRLIQICNDSEMSSLASDIAISPAPELKMLNVKPAPQPQSLPLIPMPSHAFSRQEKNFMEDNHFTPSETVGTKLVKIKARNEHFSYPDKDPMLSDDPYYENDN